MDKGFLVCDSRYGLGEKFKQSMVLMSGSAKQCCEVVNNGILGDLCVVVDPDGLEIMWEWRLEDKWSSK